MLQWWVIQRLPDKHQSPLLNKICFEIKLLNVFLYTYIRKHLGMGFILKDLHDSLSVPQKKKKKNLFLLATRKICVQDLWETQHLILCLCFFKVKCLFVYTLFLLPNMKFSWFTQGTTEYTRILLTVALYLCYPI